MTAREKYQETRMLLADAYLDFTALPNACNFGRLEQAMYDHQSQFQTVLREQAKLNRSAARC